MPRPTPKELRVFYHRDTLRQISALRKHLLARERAGTLERGRSLGPDGRREPAHRSFVRLLLRLHDAAQSGGVGARAGQDQREAASRFRRGAMCRRSSCRKSRSLLRDVTPAMRTRAGRARRPCAAARRASRRTRRGSPSNSVALVVTSPPFLDVVDYKTDNWLRCWFSGIDAASVPVTLAKTRRGVAGVRHAAR